MHRTDYYCTQNMDRVLFTAVVYQGRRVAMKIDGVAQARESNGEAFLYVRENDTRKIKF